MAENVVEKRKIPLSRKLIFTVVSFLIFFIICEGICNIYYYKTMGITGFPFNRFGSEKENNNTAQQQTVFRLPWDKETGKLKPGTYQSPYGFPYTVNSRGFRTQEFADEKTKAFRIICLGGSTTMGLESPDDKTYPAQLGKILEENGKDVEVLNFGFSSWSLNNIQKLLFEEAVKYKPDFITIYSNRNCAIYDSRYYLSFDKIDTKLEYYLFLLHAPLLKECMTYRFLFGLRGKLIKASRKNNAIKTMSFKGEVFDSVYENYFRDEYRNTLKGIIKLGNEFGYRTVLIKQPFNMKIPLQMELSKKSIDELMAIFKDQTNIPSLFKDQEEKFWLVSNALLNRQMDIIAEGNKSVMLVDPLADLLDANKNQKDLFTDYVHFTPEGNRILAENIARVFIRTKVLDN